MHRSAKISLVLLKKESLHTDITVFYFVKPHSFFYTAGQYMQLSLPHDADNRGTTRFFSLASAPGEETLMVVIKKGKSSFKHTLWSLKPGTKIEAFGPLGKFTLED